jgi:hypothetical protein
MYETVRVSLAVFLRMARIYLKITEGNMSCFQCILWNNMGYSCPQTILWQEYQFMANWR